MKVYQAFDVDEETPVQFVGVYTTKWRPEWGEPTIMFREVDQETQDLFDGKLEMREACIVAQRFIQLVKEEYPHIYDPEGGAIPLRMLNRVLGGEAD